jgi:ribosomal protein S12 methylthiotransferase
LSYKVGVVSLGCSKNLVDTETMLGILSNEGYRLVAKENEADILIVNTCGFIDTAKQESIDTIIELGEYKSTGRCKALIVCGCLAERYKDELLQELPEVDAIVGTGDFMNIVKVIAEVLEGKKITYSGNLDNEYLEDAPRVLSTPKHSAYVKISEGCDNLCTYCIIPKLRGRYRSRKVENIVQEVNQLAQKGVKEIILIAQDTTKYGLDMYNELMLSSLLEQLCKVKGIEWIRLQYCYPDLIKDNLISVIKSNEKICKYLDIPLQHCNNDILKRMNRRITKEQIVDLIHKLKASMPDIILRTSLIVGFPGETNEQFEELADFVQQTKFDRLGVFAYSQEEGTPAAKMQDQISENVKVERVSTIMDIQKQISLEKNNNKIDSIYQVLVEGYNRNMNKYFGRSFGDSPEIDGMIYFDSNKVISAGSFVPVKITKAFEYDLLGEIVDEFGK